MAASRFVVRLAIKVWLGLGLSGFVSAQTGKVEDKVLNKLQFKEYAVDFGTLKRGEKRRHLFRFSNLGEEPVTIKGVQAPCGCMVVKITNKVVSPGGDGELELELDTQDHRGDILKSVLVLTDEDVIAERVLTVKATIEDEIAIEPPVFDFGKIKKSALPLSQEIRIKPVAGQVLNLGALQYNSRMFQVSKRKDGNDWLIRLQINNGVHSGSINENLVVANSTKFLSKLSIPILGEIGHSIAHSPHHLDFGYLEPGQQLERQLHLESDQPFTMREIGADLLLNGTPIADWQKFVDLEIANQGRAEASKTVTIRLHNSDDIPLGAVHGHLYFYTKETKEKLTVSMYALLAEKKSI